MKELLVDIFMDMMISCTSDQYSSFVKEALINQRTFHENAGDVKAAFIIEAEIERLDVLHLRECMVA